MRRVGSLFLERRKTAPGRGKNQPRSRFRRWNPVRDRGTPASLKKSPRM